MKEREGREENESNESDSGNQEIAIDLMNQPGEISFGVLSRLIRPVGFSRIL